MSRRFLPHTIRGILLALAILASVRSADGQITVVPTFAVSPAPEALNAELAVATDGSILFAWTVNDGPPFVSVRRMSAAGLPLGPVRMPLGQAGYVHGIAGDANGGYALVSDDFGVALGGVRGRFLDVLGEAVGGPFVVSDVADGGVTASAVAALPSGAVFAWLEGSRFHGRLYDEAGAPRGASFLVDAPGSIAGASTIAVAARPGGGFVVLWSWATTTINTRARVYDANGTPETGTIVIGTPLVFGTAVAASPLGGFTVSAFRFGAGFDFPTEVVAYHVSDAGTPLGSTALAELASGVVALSDIAIDAAGNALVVWTEYQFAGPNPGYIRNRGRGIASNHTALAHPFVVANAPVEQVRTAVLPDGTFMNAWASVGHVRGNVVRLCTADVATCGDGIPVAECEACDDGAGNSDTTPDACRADCSLPRCGDGVTDGAHGEECDDQNNVRCDGCTPECRLEVGLPCGDGALVPGCGEDQCDDGNATAGDGCTSECRLEAIPGGGGAGTDCYAAWTADNPVNVPLLDKRGAFNATQICRDDDPQCDFDGGLTGGCTFRIQACANLTDFARCKAPSRLSSWTLVQPSAARATKDPALAAVRAAFASVPGTIVGPDLRNVCSTPREVRVPLRGVPGAFKAGKLALKAAATTYEGGRDSDKLKLICTTD